MVTRSVKLDIEAEKYVHCLFRRLLLLKSIRFLNSVCKIFIFHKKVVLSPKLSADVIYQFFVSNKDRANTVLKMNRL